MLVDDALAVTGDVGGAHVVEPLELAAAGAQVEDVAGPVDVDALSDLKRNREVVDRREVEHLNDLTLEPISGGRIKAEILLGDIAGKKLDAVGSDRGRGLPGSVELLLLDEGDDPRVGVGVEQPAHEPATDEAGEAGDEQESGHGAAVYACRRSWEFTADFGVPGDWFLAERMLRAGVRFGMVDSVLADMYPSAMNRVQPAG